MLQRTLLGMLLFCSCYSFAQQVPGKKKDAVLLPNGWSLTPAGSSLPLGDLPLNIAVSNSKKLLAITNNGYSRQTIQLVDALKNKIVDEIEIPKSWYGLKFANNDQTLYASGGNDNWILQYNIINNKLRLADSMKLGDKWPNKISPAGLDIDDKKGLLYVVTKENNSLYVIDLKTKNILHHKKLDAEAYTCLLSTSKDELYISCWGCGEVDVYNTTTNQFSSSIKVGDHPNELCLSKNGKWLYVANANDNSVSVIDLSTRKVVETLNTALYPDAPEGSTTNAVALAEDEKTLYIANADNNCLAVFDVSMPGKSVSKGFIPTGWYPTNVKVVRNKIYVTNGKGFSSFANPHGPNPIKKEEPVNYQWGDTTRPKGVQYIGGLMRGTLSIINIPNAKQLSAYSQQVYKNTPYSKEKELSSWIEKGNPVPSKIGDKGPIKYVFYIIKENRTYDQVLSDIKGGNGDTSLLLFGRHYTPNLHAIAEQFVLLDNFYCDAEVSADGHNWSMGAYATDFLEKQWPTSYGHRGGAYLAEGHSKTANNKAGFIWDACKRAGVSYRTYGEFADSAMASIPVLKKHACPYYTGWDLNVRDTTRFYQWKREFDSLLVAGSVPQFNTLRMGNDHTEGLKLNRPTPFAHVADNDLAVGMFIDYLSHSPIWKESVVFIVEDDAQNGADHVDAHRTTAYVAGGFVKRGFVDHTMYSTTSILRTIELILGLKPMSQFDAASTPMWRSFANTVDPAPYTHLNANVDLNNKNKEKTVWQRRSETFDFAKEDAVPDLEFNEVLWQALKGKPYPAPKRAAFVKMSAADKDDD